MAKKTKSSKVYRIEYSIHQGRDQKLIIAGGTSKKKALKNARNKMVPDPDLETTVKITRIKGPILYSEITPFNGVHPRVDTLQTSAPKFPADRGDSNIR
jgi:hypothetical protein